MTHAKLSNISQMDLLTAQEHAMRLSTPKFTPRTPEEWYIPQGILSGDFSPGEVAHARKDLGYVPNGAAAKFLGLDDQVVVIGLEALDDQGKTVKDPEIGTGRINPQHQLVDIQIGEDDGVLGEKFFNVLHEFGGDPHLRTEQVVIREGSPRGPEKA